MSKIAGEYTISSVKDNPPKWKLGNVQIIRKPVNTFDGGMSIDARGEGRGTCNTISFAMNLNVMSRISDGSCRDYPQFACDSTCGKVIPSVDYVTNSSEACCNCGGGSVPGHTYDWLRVLYSEGAWRRNGAKAVNNSVGTWSLNAVGAYIWSLYGNQPSCCTSKSQCRGCTNISRFTLAKDYLRVNNVTAVNKVLLQGGNLVSDTFATNGASDVETCFGCCYLAQDPNIAVQADIDAAESQCGWLFVTGSSVHASRMGLYEPLKKIEGKSQRVAYKQYLGNNYIFFSARICTQQPPICQTSGPGRN